MFERARFVKSKALVGGIAVLVPAFGVLVVFWGGQKWAVERFARAMDQDDTAAIAAHVDFDAVRVAVREQILTKIADSGRKGIALSEVDLTIQSNVTPDAFSRVVAWRGGTTQTPTRDFLSTRKFRVSFPGSGDFTFCRTGFVDWEVCDVVLPRAGLTMILPQTMKLEPDLQKQQALIQVLETHGAAMEYIFEHGRCPEDVGILIADNRLLPERAVDPWGNRVLIACQTKNATEVDVISVGPDHLRDTGDDIATR